MGALPATGRIQCADCYGGRAPAFDQLRTDGDGWRITNNPLAWGNVQPEIVVLGFSKGPTQAGALSRQRHEDIAFKGGRTNLAKILHHVGLLSAPDGRLVDEAISDPTGRFHFGSLVRCTVERYDDKTSDWKGTGGGMLDKFARTPFGQRVLTACGSRHLKDLPASTRLVIMLGMGSKGSYVEACRQLYRRIRPGDWRDVNDVTYTDGKVTVVHTEHFQSQGALLPNWLSGDRHERCRLGVLARAGVEFALNGRRST